MKISITGDSGNVMWSLGVSHDIFMMNQLFSDDEGSVSGREVQLTINEHYAKAFEYRKEREELERCMFSAVLSLAKPL